MRSVNFSSDNLHIQLQYLNRNLQHLGMAESMDNFNQKAQHAIQNIIQSTITSEFEYKIGAKFYERTGPKRRGYRKGHYSRHLTTRFGRSEILVPRRQDALEYPSVDYSIFERYKRRHKEFDRMIVLSMILGLSTRKQKRFFRKFIGDAVSPSTASRLLETLRIDLNEFRTRTLEDRYKYLLIDGF